MQKKRGEKKKMVSKKVLLVLLSLAILLVAVGAYSYVTITGLHNQLSHRDSEIDALQETVSSLEEERNSLQNNISDLESQIDALQEEIAHLQNELSHMSSTRTFVFEWMWDDQNITSGVLRMNLTFAWKGENLSIVAKINDDEYNDWDYLALAFDFGGDGVPGVGINLYANEYMWGGVLIGNRIVDLTYLFPTPSKFHTCDFEAGIGYTFNILFSTPPLQNSLRELPTDAIFIRFEDTASHGVYMYFRFGLPLG